MPTLVHITDEKNTAAILRSGIRLRHKNSGIYFIAAAAKLFHFSSMDT